ncbi:site-specific DNA-methyltransferase [Haemophilus influenzae]|uniref:DNA methyltransferase n=1 Tax=Haemophilus influenzae TaxID=727 RepID=UPI001CC46525|nr:site-specific DNA-methyltransferase [Haemophilus influenzae]MBZ5690387.1 site-specific DNA-methyltransferase [Haemophilus influenzae]MCK8913349.1 site-specific DNA-methyltransferase [Haemophilus influenzae]
MKTDIQTELTQALRSHEKVWANEEKTILAKNILLDLVEKTDPTIIGLLLGNDELKRHFFVEVNGVLVFKLQDFRFFLDKHRINNSYTKYANRIGLTDGNRFLKDSSDIVLDFPFKDCVLNGGQSTEEGEEIYFKRNNDQSDSQLYKKEKRKRQEIFFNQTLAFDEIDRLFDAKAFSKFSRYTADGKQAVGEIKRRSDGTPAENLIIKGNNLIALHSLAKQFKGKVKLIYIDPPYNTGNDGFKYNDKFNHSTWLTFMKNRLEIAKKLLADDGVIFVQCDDNEQAYLKILMDEIFERENFINTIIPEMSNASGNKIKHAIKGKKFPKLKEYILLYAKDKNQINLTIPKQAKEKWDKEYNQIIPELTLQSFERIIELIDDKKINELDKMLTGLSLVSLSEFIKSNEKVIIDEWVSSHLSVISENKLTAEQISEQAISDWKWNNAYRIVASKPNKALRKKALKLDFKQPIQSLTNPSGDIKIILTDFNRETETARIELAFAEINSSIYIGDIWFKITTTGGVAQEGGVNFTNGKKPEQLLKIILDCATKKGDIILDFHLGSGTTAAVAHKMNRQYIGIEQMDYIKTLAVERLKKVIDGEQGGISKAVNWKDGGEFVYAELAPFNESAKQQILACGNSDDIKTLFNELCERYFLKYNVSVNEFSQIIEEPEFQSLPLDEQKQMVLEMLDLNQMYVSLSEMDDEQFAGCLNDDDKALSRAFYQAEKKDGE